jgi:hypothetical protein
MNALREPSEEERWADFVRGCLESGEASTLLAEADLWLVPGLLYRRAFVVHPASLTIIVIADHSLFRVWLEANRPHLLDQYDAAYVALTLEGGEEAPQHTFTSLKARIALMRAQQKSKP